MRCDLFKERSSLLWYAFVWPHTYLYGKNVEDFKRLLEASLGQGKERLLKWLRSIDQDGIHAHKWYKPLNIFVSRTKDAFGAVSLHKSKGMGGLPKLLK